MRNVAFSIVLIALAVLQVAVISAELSQPSVQTMAAKKADSDSRLVLASTKTAGNASAF